MKVGESERCREISKTCPIDFPVETAQTLFFFYVCKSKTKNYKDKKERKQK